MANLRILRALALGEESGLDLIPRPREVVNHHEALDPPLRGLRQRRVAGAHAGNSAAPPSGGMIRAKSSEQSGGTVLNEKLRDTSSWINYFLDRDSRPAAERR
jgi:hypothetical protein